MSLDSTIDPEVKRGFGQGRNAACDSCCFYAPRENTCDSDIVGKYINPRTNRRMPSGMFLKQSRIPQSCPKGIANHWKPTPPLDDLALRVLDALRTCGLFGLRVHQINNFLNGWSPKRRNAKYLLENRKKKIYSVLSSLKKHGLAQRRHGRGRWFPTNPDIANPSGAYARIEQAKREKERERWRSVHKRLMEGKG